MSGRCYIAIGQLLNLLGGARRLAKLDPTTAFPDQSVTPDQIRYHRILVRSGKVGALLGAILGVWAGYELYLHPDTPTPDGRTITMAFVFAPLMMVAVGMLGGVSWTGIFVPNIFLRGPIGAHWMKLCGTKGPTSTRLVAVLASLLTTGFVVFLAICAKLGKV